MKDRTELKRKALTNKAKLPPVADFEPAHFIRCHSKDNDPNNNDARVWRCAFEPIKDNPDDSGNILATCGGNMVCFVDCSSGKVLRRYKDTDLKETFYTLAWTTVPSHADVRGTCNILAAAGEGGSIKLIHPTQLVMFGSIRAHKKYISCLLFHPSRPQLLFSGGHDGWIMLWDIGSPDLSQHRTDYRPLLKIDVPGTDALNLAFSEGSQTLLAACEDGCLGWNLSAALKEAGNKRTTKTINTCTYRFELSDEDETVDGMAFLPGDIVATKTVGSGSVLLWNLAEHVTSRKGKRSGSIPVEPLAELEYTHTDVEYLNMGYGGGVLGVGDDQGNIYIYNVATFTKKRPTASDQVLCPSRILEWPELVTEPRSGIDVEQVSNKEKIVVNSVCLSSSGDFIAFGTDNNLVCIMKKV